MAATMTVTHANDAVFDRPIRKVTLELTSHTDGTVSGLTTQRLTGELLRVTFDPDGTDVPTAAYDLTLLDENGVDILAGQGANLSETTSTSVCPGVPLKDGTTTSVVPFVIDSALTPGGTNMGSGKKTKVILYLR